ncbi:hypothetical protein ILUMI_18157 [Ignelater luminosus]|uniref:Uncharacterized protein n=1 Tax=Ignelater luminosus TaxID=2038154 RepID=A0A8K0G6U3_IGNLU|nr:hypothetical protein ILUMI_18157 [Ignelater luminosus]
MELMVELPVVQLSTAIFDKICRICLSLKETVLIHEVVYENVNLFEIFKDCLLIEVEKDNLPQSICEDCVTSLIQFYTFKKLCHYSDCLLRSVLNQEEPSKVGEENREEVKVEDDIKLISDDHVIQVPYSENEEKTIENDTKTLTNRKKGGELLKKRTKIKLRKSNHLPFCKLCNESFDSHDLLKLHKKSVKHPQSRTHCCKCDKKITSHHLKEHMRTHTKEKPFVCEVCQMRFTQKYNLSRHMGIHTGVKSYVCEVCGKGFTRAITLEDHLRTHTGDSPFVCSYCGMCYSNSTNYRTHLRRHAANTNKINMKIRRKLKINGIYKCNKCSKQFSTASILRTHMLLHEEKKHLCSHCGKSFTTLAGLDSHSRVHTGVKPYMCSVCDKTFSYKANLENHMRVHTKEKPFVCKICSKPFAQRTHLKYHMRTHTGEKPYTCIHCGKGFAQKHNLTVHVRTHTGETPHICPICKKGFYDSSSMRRHSRKHKMTGN